MFENIQIEEVVGGFSSVVATETQIQECLGESHQDVQVEGLVAGC